LTCQKLVFKSYLLSYACSSFCTPVSGLNREVHPAHNKSVHLISQILRPNTRLFLLIFLLIQFFKAALNDNKKSQSMIECTQDSTIENTEDSTHSSQISSLLTPLLSLSLLPFISCYLVVNYGEFFGVLFNNLYAYEGFM
jgi:hypothetical protein